MSRHAGDETRNKGTAMSARFITRFMACAIAASMGLAFAADKKCNFQATGLSLNFGTLDPSSEAPVNALFAAAGLNANTVGDCDAVSMVISGDNGLWFDGNRRMRNARGDFIPYTLSVPGNAVPGPGNGKYVPFAISGAIAASAYANASAGNYTDTVIISVTP